MCAAKAKSIAHCDLDEHMPQNPFPVVGIGASAGGLEAFTLLLRHVPENTGMAFVLVQHLDPTHPSQLTGLLSRITTIPVLEVKDGMLIQPDYIYVIPANANLELSGGKLKLLPRGDTRVPHPVDSFFSSLAKEQQSWAIGVVLSGTGTDGSSGLKEIKGVGGITFAQDEKSAKFSGMPLHAAGDLVDFVLPPEKIALELTRIGRDPYLTLGQKPEEKATKEANEKNFHRILRVLRSQTGVDFSHYRDSTIKRRIQRRMAVRSLGTMGEYAELVERDHAEIKQLFDDALINVTSFFRDPEMFEMLKERVFPDLLKSSPKTIRIWVVGCSTGQEAYSMAIALVEFLDQKLNAPAIQIFATDLSETVAIQSGRRGLYSEDIEAEVSPERLSRFFTKEDGGYRVSKVIRDLCVFAQQNIIADPPFSKMDLVSCRNLLIYFNPSLQRRVISTFHYALNSNGYLVLGEAESVGPSSDLFGAVGGAHKVFSKRGTAMRTLSGFTAPDVKRYATFPFSTEQGKAVNPVDFQKEADRILLGRSPAGVLVDSNLQVMQFRGRTNLYLEPPVGAASFNLLKMARDNLGIELGAAVKKAGTGKTPIRRTVPLRDRDASRTVTFEVIPVTLPGSEERCFLILFEEAIAEDRSPRKSREKRNGGENAGVLAEKDRELEQLRGELSGAREYLQSIIAQHEAANEELKCMNEESLSSNEELQSTNEQLSTAKEELQSTNEELQTLNEELRTRNVELNQLSNDLTNLLAGLRIPIVMLDSQLRIRRFNSGAAQLLILRAAMIGKPVSIIDSALIWPGLETLLPEVLEKATPREVEVRHDNGRWFSVRLHPYVTSDNRIDGVILAVVDIDDLKRAHERVLDYVTAIVDTVGFPLLILKPDLRVNSASEAFYHAFRVAKPETENRLIYELGNGQWNIPELRRRLEEILSGGESVKNWEVTHTFPLIGKRTMRLNGRRLDQKAGAAPLIFLSIEDISEQKRIEENSLWLGAIVESSTDAIIGKNLEGIITSCNQAALTLFGYAREEMIGQSVMMLIPKDHQNEESEIIERIKRGERIEHFETVRQRKDGSLVEVSLTISPVKNIGGGEIIGESTIAREITDRKRAEKQLEESLEREKEARGVAETATRAKDDFLAALSHELRTPLNPVLLLSSESAENPRLSTAVRARFASIRNNVELEARIIDDLLDITRISRGKLALQMELLDVHAVLKEAIATVQSEIDEKQIVLSSHLTAGNPTMQGDTVRLLQVFWNVFKNAIKFTPPQGKIGVETSVEGSSLKVKITDSGIGMTPAELEHIFLAFAQGLHSTSQARRFGGLGLGLAISRKLVEMHSGNISAASAGPGKGSTFFIELPLAPAEAKPESPENKSNEPFSSEKGGIEGTRILLVEDHVPTRTTLEQLLTRRHCKIFSSGSIAEAREIVKREKIDFVISDIGLPDGSGNELMAELFSQFGLRGIALTGYGMEEDVERSLAAGFVAHLTKPVRAQELERTLQRGLKTA